MAGPGGTATSQQTIPIVVDGVMYVNPPGGGVIALDAATGAVKWKWVPSATAPAPNNFGPATQQRGVSVGEGKVYTTAAGNRMVALNKDTGALVWAVVPTDNGAALGASKVAPRYYDGLVFMGTNDNDRGAAFALRASDGSLVWTFYGAYPHGTSFTDVNGTTFDAGDTWTTKVTPNDTPNNCYLTGGAAPWQQGTIDPELGMIYIPFGNVRSCTWLAEWRRPAGRQPVRQLGRRARLQDRGVQVALPGGPARHLGHGQCAVRPCSPTS